jgi:DNA-binding transcriptional LysR family regulator
MNPWDGISEFVSVAELGSFTNAARHLSVSVAHVSRQIGALEDRLDAKLFYRTTRRVTLTELGEIYYQRCRPLLEGLEEAEHALSDLQENAKGRLRITTPVAYGELRIVPLLTDFLKNYPELDLDIKVTNRRLDLVSEGIDIAIRLGNLDDSSLMAKKLGSRQLITCAAPSYLEIFGEPHSLSELDHHSCLLGTLDYWRYNDNGNMRTIPVKGRFRCNNGPALLEAALAGFGIVQLPDYYVEGPIVQGHLVTLLDSVKPDEEGIWAVYPHNRHLSPKIRLMIDYLADKL